MIYKLPFTHAIEKHKAVEEKARKLGHVIEYGEYEVYSERKQTMNSDSNIPQIRSEREASLKIRCEAHSTPDTEPIQTTYYNYLRARTGLPCCGKQRVKQKLQARVFSEESKQKMSVSMKKVWSTKPRAKDNRDSIDYDRWRAEAQARGGYKCAITGMRPRKLVVHHPFSMKHFESIMYDPENAVLLAHEIHEQFHRIWGYRNPTTIDQFLQFLSDLMLNTGFRDEIFRLAIPRAHHEISVSTIPRSQQQQDIRQQDIRQNDSYDSFALRSETTISSQSSKEFDEGSETRVYDPERIKRLHERMAQSREILYSQLTPDEKTLADDVRMSLRSSETQESEMKN